jgi:hypothetical protein
MRRGCNDCTLGPGRPRLDEVRGQSACLALPSGSIAPMTLGTMRLGRKGKAAGFPSSFPAALL